MPITLIRTAFYVDGGTRILIERNIVHDVDYGIELASEHSGGNTTADWKQPWRSARPLSFPAVALVLAFGALYFLEHYR